MADDYPFIEPVDASSLPAVPSPPEPADPVGLRQAARVLVLIGGLGIAVVGLVGGVVGILGAVLRPDAGVLARVTFGVSFLALCVVLGLALAWQAWQALKGSPSGSFAPRRIGIWLLAFPLVVLGGWAVLTIDLAVVLAFPPFHVAAAVLPPLIIVVAVGRALPGVASRREIILELGSGAFISTSMALILEVVAGLVLLFMALGAIALQPGGMEKLQALVTLVEDPTWLQDPMSLAHLATLPLVVAGILLVAAGVVPLLEELVKTIGVPLLSYRRPSLAQAYLWGLSCGAGFALAEGLFNATGGLDSWPFVISMRAGASLLHAFTGALGGMAWYYLIMERRWLKGLGLFAGAVGVHGLWNGLAAAVSLLALTSLEQGDSAQVGIAGLAMVVSVGLLLATALGVLFGLVALTRHLRDDPAPDLIARSDPFGGTASPEVEKLNQGDREVDDLELG